MALGIPPDESGLKSRFELDRSRYRVISGRRSGRVESVQPRRSVRNEIGLQFSGGFRPGSVPAPELFDPQGSVLPVPFPASEPHYAPLPTLLIPMLTLSAAPGGAGKSTILSSLARILSSMGENLLLIYPESQSAVPMHFGGEPLAGHVRRFIPARGDAGSLHMYAHPDVGRLEDEADEWLPREVNALANRVGRVVCEVTNSQRKLTAMAAINLRILVPDIASVLSVNDDLLTEEQCDRGQTFYLLNKYDKEVSFHREVRERLSWMLGDRLLPFTIRRSDQFAEALAAGITVMSYTPKAAVVGDLKLLAQWVRSSMEYDPQSKSEA